MDASYLKEALLSSDLVSFLEELLPEGKVVGNYYEAGSIGGEEGRSLKVRIGSDSAGVWSDFADSLSGDIFQLIMMVKGLGFRECLDYVRDYLGIKERPRPELIRTVKRSFSTPSLPQVSCADEVLQYLTKVRGLSEDTIRAFKVSSAFYSFPEGAEMPAVVYPFYNLSSQVELVKYMGIYRQEDRRYYAVSPNSKPVLFGWQALNPKSRYLILVKDAIEAMSLYQLGFPALAVPFGEGKKSTWLEHEFENLEPYESIYLIADNDKPGKEMIDDLIPKLGRHRCSYLLGSPIEGLKDINDALIAGCTPEQLKLWLQSAQSCDPSVLQTVDAFTDEVIDNFHNPSLKVRGYPLPFPSVVDDVRIRLGEISIWTGYNGSGKSEILGQISLHLSGLGLKSLIASLEMSPAVVIGRLLRQHYKNELPSVEEIKQFAIDFRDRILLYDFVGTANIEDVLEVFKYAVRKYGVQYFVLDSLLKLSISGEDFDGQRELINKLQAFAREYKVHVSLVAHSRKRDNEDTPSNKMDVRGSAAITDLAELVVSIWRNRKKERDIQVLMTTGLDKTGVKEAVEAMWQREPDSIVSVLKNRWNGKEPQVLCYFDAPSLTFTEM